MSFNAARKKIIPHGWHIVCVGFIFLYSVSGITDWTFESLMGHIIVYLISFVSETSPTDYNFSLKIELCLLFLNPGFYVGLFIGYTEAQTYRQIYKSLIPAIICSLSTLPLCFLPGGALLAFIIIPTIIVISIPYTLIGAVIGIWTRKKGVGDSPHTMIGCVTILVLLAALYPRDVWAWGNKKGHPYIIDRSIVLLERDSQSRFHEINKFEDTIKLGSDLEDGSWLTLNPHRVLNHFYNPFTDRRDKGLATRALPSFASRASPLIAQQHWRSAIESYNRGDKVEAYEYLGRMAHHVTGDMFQPGHVHDDIHAPHIFGGDEQTIEDLFDSNLAAVTAEDLNLKIAVEPGELTTDDIFIYGDASARLAYQNSSFEGEISTPSAPYPDGTPVGNINLRNGESLEIRYYNPQDLAPVEGISYRINGNSKQLIYDPDVRGDIGVLLPGALLRQDWWEIPPDEQGNAGRGRIFYFDAQDQFSIGGKRLDQHLIDLLIPEAMSFTAGLIKQAAQTFDSMEPQFIIRAVSNFGTEISSGGHTNHPTFWVTDVVDPETNGVPSGIYRTRILSLTSSGTIKEVVSETSFQGESAIPRYTRGNLPDGTFAVEVCDGLGNCGQQTVTIDSKGPAITLATTNPETLFEDVQTSTYVRTEKTGFIFTASDTLSGIQRIEVVKLGLDGEPSSLSQMFVYASAQASVTEMLGPLAVGEYQLRVFDASNNVSTGTVLVDPKPLSIKVIGVFDTRHGAQGGGTLRREDLQPILTSTVHPIKEFKLLGPVSVQTTEIDVQNLSWDSGFEGQGVGLVLPELIPGSYQLVGKDVRDNQFSANLTIGTYSIKVDTEGARSTYNSSLDKFLATVPVTADSNLGVRSVTLNRRAGMVYNEIRKSNQGSASFSDLEDGQYQIQGHLGNGESFSLYLNLATRTRTVIFGNTANTSPGVSLDNVVLSPGSNSKFSLYQEELDGPFSQSGTYTSQIKNVTSIEGITFLGGIVEQSQLNESNCSYESGNPFMFHPISWGYCLNSGYEGCTQGKVLTNPIGVGQAGQIKTSIKSGYDSGTVSNLTEVVTVTGGFAGLASNNYSLLSQIESTCPSVPIPVGRYMQVIQELSAQPNSITARCTETDPDTDQCIRGASWKPGTWGPEISAPRINIRGQELEHGESALFGSQYLVLSEGDKFTAPLLGIGSAEFSGVTSPGSVTSSAEYYETPEGFESVPPNTASRVQADFPFSNAKITLRFDSAGVTEKQRENLQLLHVKNEETGQYESIATDTGPDYITGIANSLSPFIIAYPVSVLNNDAQGSLGPDGRPEFVINSRNASLSVVRADTETGSLADFLAAKEAEGYFLASSIYGAEGGEVSFIPDATLTMTYSANALQTLDVDPLNPLLVQINPASGLFNILPGQQYDVSQGTVTAQIQRARGLYGIFVRPNDRTPPTTRLAAQGASFLDNAEVLYLSAASQLGFVSSDSGTLVGVAAGVQETRYLLDPTPTQLANGLTDATKDAFVTYNVDISISAGTHTLAFGTIDSAGNIEPMQVRTVVLDASPPTTQLLFDELGVSSTGNSYTIYQSTLVGFSSADEIGEALTSGIARIEYSVDQSDFMRYFGS